MIRKFHQLKALILFTLIFSSVLFIFCQTGKSGPLDPIYECTPIIEIDFDKSVLKETVIPFDEPKKIPLEIRVKIAGPYSDLVTDALNGVKLILDLKIEEVSDGCLASITPPIILLEPSQHFQTENATLSFTINKNFEAGTLKEVKINVSSRRLGKKATLVKYNQVIQDVSFFVGYYPQLSFAYPESNVKNINPSEVAKFPIEIENWGNSVTNANFEIEDIPDGWQVNIVDNLTLDSNLFSEDVKKTISLSVKPPISFGYHEDRAVIKIKMIPKYYDDASVEGEPHYLYFIVQSMGSSTVGSEYLLILVAIVIIFLIAWKGNYLNFGNNKHRGEKK